MKTTKIVSVVITAALLLGGSAIPSVSAAAVKQVKIQPVSVQMTFDGTQLVPPAGQFTFNYQGTTYVPLRFVSYALQKNVEWDGKKSQVTISNPTESQLVAIKERVLNSSKSSDSSKVSATPVSISPINAKYVFNGESKAVPKGQISFLHNGTIYVPMRFVAESTGSVITWDPKTKAIAGSSQEYLQSQKQDNTGTGTTTPAPSTDSKENAGQTSNPAAGQTGGASGAGGGASSAYERITKDTEAQLNSLKNKSESILLGLAKEYIKADTDAKKQQLLNEGEQQLESLTAEFTTIINSAEQQLENGGYSTDIIKQYRQEFESQIEAGKELAESMG